MNWIAENYSLVTVMILSVFVFTLGLFLLTIIKLNGLRKQYKVLLRGMEGKNLEETIQANSTMLQDVLVQLQAVKEETQAQGIKSVKALSKVGLVRFNAFTDTGGDLSFSMALLNELGNGVVLSSIYGRDDARTYAKPITQGKSSYQLSQEEVQAIRLALD